MWCYKPRNFRYHFMKVLSFKHCIRGAQEIYLPMLAFSSNTGLVNSKYVSASDCSKSSMVDSSPSESTNPWSSLTIISSSASISSSARTTPTTHTVFGSRFWKMKHVDHQSLAHRSHQQQLGLTTIGTCGRGNQRQAQQYPFELHLRIIGLLSTGQTKFERRKRNDWVKTVWK